MNCFFKVNTIELTENTPSEQETKTELGMTVDNHWFLYD
jgi:hypothetical protein